MDIALDDMLVPEMSLKWTSWGITITGCGAVVRDRMDSKYPEQEDRMT